MLNYETSIIETSENLPTKSYERLVRDDLKLLVWIDAKLAEYNTYSYVFKKLLKNNYK